MLSALSPEQLEGQEADARSDIFAFGAMLYEMATGKKVFQGKTQASLIASILASQRRLGRLPFNVRAASEYRESHA